MPAALLLLRHGSAGSRERWVGDDTLRPLDTRGQAQAAALPAHLDPYVEPPLRLVVSPMLRCVQTVEPLAAARGLPVVTDERLAEASMPLPSEDGWPDAAWLGSRALAALDEAQAGDVRTLVVCSHGEVLPAVFAALLGRGSLPGAHPELPDLTAKALPKGGAWYLLVGSNTTRIETIPPPRT